MGLLHSQLGPEEGCFLIKPKGRIDGGVQVACGCQHDGLGGVDAGGDLADAFLNQRIVTEQ